MNKESQAIMQANDFLTKYEETGKWVYFEGFERCINYLVIVGNSNPSTGQQIVIGNMLDRLKQITNNKPR